MNDGGTEMIEEKTGEIFEPAAGGVGASLMRIGRAGFRIQIAIGALPLLTGAFVFLFGVQGGAVAGRFQIVHLLAIASLLTLLFTTVWFLLYVGLGRRIAAGEAWTRRGLLRRVWTGVLASAAGVAFSTLVMAFEVGYMLFRFLEAPQGGVPVVQIGDQSSWISAIDMLSLLALNFTVIAEVIVLVMGLLLLHRVAQAKSQAGAQA